ncbi:hypothetical protein MRBLPE1_005096 [Paenibacillus sp. LPE1-1-1.1]
MSESDSDRFLKTGKYPLSGVIRFPGFESGVDNNPHARAKHRPSNLRENHCFTDQPRKGFISKCESSESGKLLLESDSDRFLKTGKYPLSGIIKFPGFESGLSNNSRARAAITF